MSKHTYADSTLKSWTKDELIHQIRILERNLAIRQELVNNQVKLLETWAPVVHAYWRDYHTLDPYCSNCEFSYDREEGEYAQTTDYCGNCGAKMDGGDTDVLNQAEALPVLRGRSYANKYYSVRHGLQIGNVHEVQGKG